MHEPNIGPGRRLLSRARAWIGRRARGASLGQGMAEYSLVVVLIAIVVIAILLVLGHRVSDLYSNINTGLAG